MVNTLIKSTFREIRQSLGRFLAILAIIGLGVGFFVGLRLCQPSMILTGRDYLEEQNLYDFRLLSPLGFGEEDEAFFDEEEGIAAEGAYFVDFLSEKEDLEIVLRAHSLTKIINKPRLTAGKMPTRKGECLGDARYFSPSDIGKIITVSENNDEKTKTALASNRFTLTGLAQSPLYLNFERGSSDLGNGSVTAFLYLTEADFKDEAFHELYLTINTEEAAYTDAYDEAVSAVNDDVTAKAEARADQRYEDIRGDALAALAEAEAELEDGRAAYEKAKKDSEDRLAAAEKQLNEGEEKYRQGLKDYEEGKKRLAAGREKLNAAKEELKEQQASLAAAGSALDEQLKPLLEKKAALEGEKADLDRRKGELDANPEATEEEIAAYEAANDAYQQAYAAFAAVYEPLQAEVARYQEGKARFDAAAAALAKNEADLDELEAALAAAPAKSAAARRELDQGRADYEKGKRTARKELSEAEATLREAEEEIEAGYADLENLEKGKVYVLTREENIGYRCFDNDTAIVAAISLIFPVFFFLVAALVCVTTMTRMIDEQRTQIGVLKAMGYGNGAVIAKYLFYAGSASLIGAIIGFIAGSHIIPRLIWNIYGIMYGFAPLEYAVDVPLALISVAAALLCALGSTYLACRRSLLCPAAELIRQKAPKSGRRVFLEYITPLWKRLSFLQKVSIRGVFRYRSRLILMILGIGGCTALLLTGFGISDSIKNIINDEYSEIILYEYDVSFDHSQNEASFRDFLNDNKIRENDGLLVHSSGADISGEKRKKVKTAALIVPADGEVEGFFSLHRGKRSIPFPNRGEVVISNALAESVGVSRGDRITIKDGDLGTMTATVADICDNYVNHYVFLSEDSYEQGFHHRPEYKNGWILSFEGEDPNERGAALARDDGVRSIVINSDTAERINHTLSRMDYIVLLVMVCAAALAFIVLYNLTNINITERVREIATIKVLGFYPKEVVAYVFREISVLSVLGSLAGLLMGRALHLFVMSQIKIDLIHFPCRIFPVSYLLSVGLTLLFTAVVAAVIQIKLKRIPMAESLKANE